MANQNKAKMQHSCRGCGGVEGGSGSRLISTAWFPQRPLTEGSACCSPCRRRPTVVCSCCKTPWTPCCLTTLASTPRPSGLCGGQKTSFPLRLSSCSSLVRVFYPIRTCVQNSSAAWRFPGWCTPTGGVCRTSWGTSWMGSCSASTCTSAPWSAATWPRRSAPLRT